MRLFSTLVLMLVALALPAQAETVKLLGETRDGDVVVLALKAEGSLDAGEAEALLKGVIEREKKMRPLAVYAYLYPSDSKKRGNPLLRQKDVVDAVFFMIRDRKALGWRWSYKYTERNDQDVFVDCTRPVRKCNINQKKPFKD